VGVEDFLLQLQNTRSGVNKSTPNFILGNTSTPKISKLGAATGGFKFKPTVPGADSNFGALFSENIANRKTSSPQFQTQWNNDNVTKLASDIISKSAGQIQTNEFGIPQRTKLDFNTSAKNRLSSITERGELATQTEEAKGAWQSAKSMQDLSAYGLNVGTVGVYDPKNMPAGANSNNMGAKAVALAMTAYKNGTPYVWGGNSLTGGVDCSGLVQQVYAKLGIKVPRTTYEQAKSGKIVPLASALPGDLIFYNTGSSDPNGIGSLSHVAIYIGNGKVVEAHNTKVGMRVSNVTYSGKVARVVRPW
jgi:cell wall-associated NlpC family hydrolase